MRWFGRGYRFEKLGGAWLNVIAAEHPDAITVDSQPVLALNDGTKVRPDFRLTIQMPYVTDVWTIECQSRKRSSNKLQHKIRAMKNLSPANRVMFDYERESFLSEANRKGLDADGVTRCNRLDFLAFLLRLSGTWLSPLM